ncbi:MAG: CDP-diacylglycerol--glycerol-3-phosphate 3-phosphatidyltransferase [Gammaproteobacteria bacterium]|nr:CDP-diacylglycerol--glycerol-3-phosphate 3-phosphatidyltransferase [Gammaproteobacteria bacterium]MDH5800538.1 CDP-diacylglycerol--glycerol-3-phosphate 3-phosphatidyltransferase [Gammaproteobacteria bacterium]
MHFNIPIFLTLLRIVAIPVFVVVFYIPVWWSNLIVTVIFCVAAITDWLDGYLARKWQQTSAFGAFLDPVADKLMVTCALVLLVDRNPTHYPGYVMAIPAGVIIGREIVISALREWMAELGHRAHVAVSIIGKVKTMAQMFAIPFLLYAQPIYGMPITMTGLVLIYLSAILTIWSMFIYLKASWPVLSK